MFSFNKNLNFEGYKAIIPSIGVGNVAQLGADLIIATLKMKRIGNIWHPSLMPIYGPPAYQHDPERTVACEVYGDEAKKLIIFQLRSPLVQSFVNDFLQQLTKFLTENKIAQILILTSSHHYEKHSVEATSFAYVANSQFLSKVMKKEDLDKCNWTEFSGNVIHGGGIANKLWKMCTENELSAIVLFKFVSEGDNSPDASQLVGKLNKICPLFQAGSKGQVKLVIPVSWNLLFGNDPPELIF